MADLWYLATPYSKYPAGVEQAFIDAAKQGAMLIKHGINIICPITMSHPFAVHAGMSGDFEMWEKLDFAIIDNCKSVIVCQLDSWDKSTGVTKEIAYAKSLGKPVYYMLPDTLGMKATPW